MTKRRSEMDLEEAKRLATSFQNHEVIAITLENTASSYYVQKVLLLAASEYFSKALDGGFEEQRTKSLTLPGCELETFEMFLYWLCERDVIDSRAIINSYPVGSEEMRNAVAAQQLLLIKLWTFADKYLIPRLQNAVMRRLVDLLDHSYTRAESVCLAFTIAPPTSVLREVVIAAWAHCYRGANGYGSQKFREEDYNCLGQTPGVVAAMLDMFSKCGSASCSTECTNMPKLDLIKTKGKWLVPEK